MLITEIELLFLHKFEIFVRNVKKKKKTLQFFMLAADLLWKKSQDFLSKYLLIDI